MKQPISINSKSRIRISLLASRISFLSALVFLVLLILLHIIKPELDPSWHFISEYELGHFGWLMRLAFLSLALSCVSLAIALWIHVKNSVGRLGMLLLIVTASGMIIASIFTPDPLNTPRELVSQASGLHDLGALLDSIPFASILIVIGMLFRNKRWKEKKFILIGSVVMVWFGMAVFISAMVIFFPADMKFGQDVLLGWPNRIMIVTQALWLMVISHQVKITGNKELKTS